MGEAGGDGSLTDAGGGGTNATATEAEAEAEEDARTSADLAFSYARAAASSESKYPTCTLLALARHFCMRRSHDTPLNLLRGGGGGLPAELPTVAPGSWSCGGMVTAPTPSGVKTIPAIVALAFVGGGSVDRTAEAGLMRVGPVVVPVPVAASAASTANTASASDRIPRAAAAVAAVAVAVAVALLLVVVALAAAGAGGGMGLIPLYLPPCGGRDRDVPRLVFGSPAEPAARFGWESRVALSIFAFFERREESCDVEVGGRGEAEGGAGGGGG